MFQQRSFRSGPEDGIVSTLRDGQQHGGTRLYLGVGLRTGHGRNR